MSYPFVKAKYFHEGGNSAPTRIVIHDMEMPEKPDTAEACAKYFQTIDREASAHYCVDNNSVVQCVLEADIAFHAPPNTNSIGIEHAGYAKQSTGEWLDPFGTAMLRDVSAPLVRDIAARHGIPLVWLSVQDLLDGKHGITSHNNVSLAWHKSTHTDPGPTFPVDQFMAWVTNGATSTTGDGLFMALSDDRQNDLATKIDQIHKTTTASGYIEKLVNMEQDEVGQVTQILADLKASPDHGAGAGDIDPETIVNALRDALVKGTK